MLNAHPSEPIVRQVAERFRKNPPLFVLRTPLQRGMTFQPIRLADSFIISLLIDQSSWPSLPAK
jgi:hypothetical protein